MVLIGGCREIAKNRDLEDSGIAKNLHVQHFEMTKKSRSFGFLDREKIAICLLSKRAKSKKSRKIAIWKIAASRKIFMCKTLKWGKNRDPLDFWIAKNRDLLACLLLAACCLLAKQGLC